MRGTAFSMTDVLLLITVTSWAISFLFTKVSLLELSPLAFASFRTLLSAPLFAVVLALKEKHLRFRREHVLLFVFLGISGNFLNNILWTLGVKLTTVANASILWTTAPIYVGIFSLLLGWEKLRARLIFGISICFIGVYIVIGKGFGMDFDARYVVGDIIILLASMSWAVFTILSGFLVKAYSILRITALAAMSGFFFMLPVAWWESTQLTLSEVSIKSWLCLGFVALCSNVLGQLFWMIGIGKIGPVKTACYMFLVPLIATFSGVIFLKESLSLFQFMGASLILMGVYLARFY